tara:strand:+ start:346 stop:624 length:279 start_codon:yes stop_codon:yes gene_type:complete
MDVQKLATYGTAVAVVGTGGVVGGGQVLDNMQGGPQKRMEAEATELRMIVREEVRAAFKESWPKTTGHIKGIVPNGNYREVLNGSNTSNKSN